MRWPCDLWIVDPMPIAPDAPLHSAVWWRWWSRVTLQARAEADRVD
jgi:hypothetical protein